MIFLGVGAAYAAPPAKEFGRLPLIYDAAISPNGQKVAAYISTGDGYGLIIYDLKVGLSEAEFIKLEGRSKPNWIKWANNKQLLAGIRGNYKLDGVPLSSGYIYTVNTETMANKILVKPGIRQNFRQENSYVIDWLRDDPNHILMAFSKNNAQAPDVQKVNVETGDSECLKRGSERIQNWITDLRGEVRIGQGLKDNIVKEKWRLTIRDAETDDWREYAEYPGLDGSDDIFGFMSDPNEMIIGRRQGKSTQGLYVYDLRTKSVTRKLFHNDDYDVSGIVKSADGKDVVGAVYVADTKQTEMFSGYEGPLQRIGAKLDGFTVDFVDQTPDGKTYLVKVSNAAEPGALFIYNDGSGKVGRIASYREKLLADEMGKVMPVQYTARDGQKIPAYVTLPISITANDQLKNVPFIILPHGGPYARSRQRFDYFAQFFATRGFGVLQMNFRGSAGYGQAFKDAGRENWVVMQEDVEDGTRWLVEKGYADPDRVCIAGWSYGGYAALMGTIKNPDLYNCTISIAGVTDLKDLISDQKKYRFGKIRAKNSIISGFDGSSDLKDNSPVKRAGEMTGPVFLAHGTMDINVHYDQFKRMKSALKGSEADVTALSFKDEDHYMSKEENRMELFIELDKFLEKSVGVSEFAR